MDMDLSDFVRDFAAAIVTVDSTGPVAANARTGVPFQPGIGPHTESATVDYVVRELQRRQPELYASCRREVPYACEARQKCDLCIGDAGQSEWAIEIKMLRVMGDNGKPNDNMLMHILSPYPVNRSAVTDCEKLLRSQLPGKKAIAIFAYEYDEYPAEPVIRAFELLAADRVNIGRRHSAVFEGCIHPVHRRGCMYAWEISALDASPSPPAA